MEQTIIVAVIVILAAGYIIRSYYKKYQASNQSRCNCGGCTDCRGGSTDCGFPME